MRVLDAFMYLLAYCWSLSLKKVMTGTAIGIGLSIAPVNPLKSAFAEVTAGGGLTTLEGEALKLYTQGLRLEGPGEDLHEAQRVFEQVVQTEPDFIYGWTNLGNVLTSLGNLDQALLCYNKAISLRPPSDALAVTVLNRATIEMATGKMEQALRDLNAAEKLAGSSMAISTNKAVAMSNMGDWTASADIFDSVINKAEKNALPWWLRYAMSLLETDRAAEAMGYYQRVLKRFPDETECKAFGAALYMSLNNPKEAREYWNRIPQEEREPYRRVDFVEKQLHWGPRAVSAYKRFLSTSAT